MALSPPTGKPMTTVWHCFVRRGQLHVQKVGRLKEKKKKKLLQTLETWQMLIAVKLVSRCGPSCGEMLDALLNVARMIFPCKIIFCGLHYPHWEQVQRPKSTDRGDSQTDNFLLPFRFSWVEWSFWCPLCEQLKLFLWYHQPTRVGTQGGGEGGKNQGNDHKWHDQLTGSTRPLSVISPVMAVSERVQRPLGAKNRETNKQTNKTSILEWPTWRKQTTITDPSSPLKESSQSIPRFLFTSWDDY